MGFLWNFMILCGLKMDFMVIIGILQLSFWDLTWHNTRLQEGNQQSTRGVTRRNSKVWPAQTGSLSNSARHLRRSKCGSSLHSQGYKHVWNHQSNEINYKLITSRDRMNRHRSTTIAMVHFAVESQRNLIPQRGWYVRAGMVVEEPQTNRTFFRGGNRHKQGWIVRDPRGIHIWWSMSLAGWSLQEQVFTVYIWQILTDFQADQRLRRHASLPDHMCAPDHLRHQHLFQDSPQFPQRRAGCWDFGSGENRVFNWTQICGWDERND